MLEPDNSSRLRPMTVPDGIMKSRRNRNRIRNQRFAVGEQVRFADGTLAGTGVVDAVTADFSIIWIWADGGSGRRMFLQGMGAIVEPLQGNDEGGASNVR